MSKYMETPHYRVNRAAATMRVMGTHEHRPIFSLGGIELTLADLEAVIRDSAHLYTEPHAQDNG